MKLKQPNSPFYRWWNSYSGKRIVSAAYSAGASLVILGALFKILHLPHANIMLMVGMITESIIFALGIFDKPYREYDWSRIFDFKGEESDRITPQNLQGAAVGVVPTASRQVGLSYSESLSDEDVKKLSEGIKNLSNTADNLLVLTNVAVAANGLAKNIETASNAAVSFADTQKKLNNTTESLAASYQGITTEMSNVVNGTKSYAGKVEEINKELASINSIYEIQLRHIQAQNEGLNKQVETLRAVSGRLDEINTDMDKMKEATAQSFAESEKYKTAAKKLSRQVEDLNAVYGNMLNALN